VDYLKNDQYPKFYFYRRLVQAKLFIDKSYADNIDLDNIADEAYFSKFHFIRRFKTVYLKTPHQYLIDLRIQKAGELLKNGLTVSAVCYAVGFESLSSFSRLFKRTTGMCPSAYLAQHQATKMRVAESPLTFIPACFAQQYGWMEK